MKQCGTRPTRGYSPWFANAVKQLPINADVIEIIVRAPGFATEVRRFAGESLTELRARSATIELDRGVEIELKLDIPEGMDVPADFLPQMYFSEYAWRVRSMWQPVNLRAGRAMPDFNMLNVSRITDRVYSFQLSERSTPFFVAFQNPGWLQFYEVGPLSQRDVESDLLEIEVPRPAALQVAFETGDLKESATR